MDNFTESGDTTQVEAKEPQVAPTNFADKYPFLEVNQYTDFPDIPRKSTLVTVVGSVDMDSCPTVLHGHAIMMNHGEPTPESEAELLRLAHLFKGAPHLLEAVEVLKNRLETIAELHPELDLASDIVLAYGAIWDARNMQRTWRDAIKVSRARGDWLPEHEAEWGDDAHHGPTVLPVLTDSERAFNERGVDA